MEIHSRKSRYNYVIISVMVENEYNAPLIIYSEEINHTSDLVVKEV